jgi:radical SAM protein with 4Fe4S-binding SPASM domain
MSKDLAYSIILESAKIGVHSLKMNWRGESTMNPYFGQICNYAKDLSHGSTFIERITNSNFQFNTDRNDIFEGLCSQTKVKVSFDSFIPAVLESQRLGAKYEIIRKNIDKFYHYHRRDNELIIQAVRTTKNKDEDIEGTVKKYWPSATVSIRDVVSGRTEKSTEHLEIRQKEKSRIPCRQAFVRLIFDVDGNASPCCPNIDMSLNLGTVKDRTIKEIFNGFKAQTLRRQLINGSAFHKNPCLNCSSFESFKGYKPNWRS